MNIKKLLVWAGLLGVLLLGIGVVGAQDATGTPAPSDERPGLHAARVVADIVAQETGLQPAEILAQVQQGQTLADIIQANGGDVQSVIDQSVAQLTEDINKAVAGYPYRGKVTRHSSLLVRPPCRAR